MATYGIRHQIFYYRKSGGETYINILEKSYTGSVSQLLAADDVLTIDYDGNIDNIYKPTLGSGATIKIVATPLSMQHLFTVDAQKYIVRIYNRVENVSYMIWQGFINTDIYNESYSTPSSLRSIVTIHCNDGMSVLEDIPYTQTVGGSNYTGFSLIKDVMDDIFSKLEITFTDIISYTNIRYIDSADESINPLEYLAVNNENYYDEDGEAMSCRDVLESIYGGLGLVMSFKGDIIYIIDPVGLNISTTECIGYSISPSFFYLPTVITNYTKTLDISNDDIDWYETGQELDITQLFNKIKITYSPYSFIDSGYDFNGEDNAGNLTSYGSYTNNGITYNIYIGVTMADWVLSGGATFEGIEETAPDEEDIDFYIKQTVGGSGTFTYAFPFSNIKQDDSLMLELSMDVYVNTKHVSNIIDPAETGTDISSMYLTDIKIKVGSQWYIMESTATGYWSDTEGSCRILVRQIDATKTPYRTYTHGSWFSFLGYNITHYYYPTDESLINDSWITSYLYIPLKENDLSSALIEGSISITLGGGIVADPLPDAVLNILIKNVNISVVNTKKVKISNDSIEYSGTIDSASNMKESSLELSLTSGIGTYGCSKGAFSSVYPTDSGLNITGLTRVNSSTVYKSSELLLQNLLSQYSNPRCKLTGTLRLKEFIAQNIIFSKIFYILIQDSSHLTNVNLYIVNGTYNDREEKLEVEMVEITDSLEAIS